MKRRDLYISVACCLVLAVIGVGVLATNASEAPQLLPAITLPGSTSTSSTSTTAKPPDPVLLAAGDLVCNKRQQASAKPRECQMQAVANIFAAVKPTIGALLGDLMYDNGDEMDSTFHQIFGEFKDILRPAVGNHDGPKYWSYFGPVVGEKGKGWYAYDLGTWRVIALNGNCTLINCKAGGEQDTWFRQQLDSHPGKCVAAYWHQPRFSSGPHGQGKDAQLVDPLWRAAVEGGVDVVLNGHDHDYEYFAPMDAAGNSNVQGTAEFVVGTGGRKLYDFKVPPKGPAQNTAYGALKLTLHDGSYDWQFITEPGQTFVDKGSAACN